MASLTSSSTATSRGIARPNTEHFMLELEGYDEWDFIDGYARGSEVLESGSSGWTLTQATDQGQYPFSRVIECRLESPKSHVSAEREASKSQPTLLLKPRRKNILKSRTPSPSGEEHGQKNNRRWSKIWLRLSRQPTERTKQSGEVRRGNGESFNGRKDVNSRVQSEQVEVDIADEASTQSQPSRIWVALQGRTFLDAENGT
ncbi:uncharacterized protein EV420DRAFT_1484447 [Desarmillaria tabescens]|uniref:Uncharacterized protein n=1 Tax=Armillaria tabescens TaxID=1929756 RepID=A0AA39JNL5_ARMTA|nr:uncharacterized protein EV420DRAFT_1484447 [Desarmillaria tabescens]KAK0445016.1 hypothetical protein EV420DRAFT_1484447 [Desarmillaria tabescens]